MTTPSEREQILEKIAKLLAMATSTNPNEAAIASEKAVELMARYSIGESDVEDYKAGAVKPKVQELKVNGQRPDHLQDFEAELASGVGRALECRVIYSGPRVKFIGFKTDAEFAAMLFTSMRDWILINSAAARAEYVKEFIATNGVNPSYFSGTSRHPRAWQRNWSMGAAASISMRCRDTFRKVAKEMERYDMILVKSEAIDTFVEEKYPKLGVRRSDDAGRGYSDGFIAGKNAPLPGGKELNG